MKLTPLITEKEINCRRQILGTKEKTSRIELNQIKGFYYEKNCFYFTCCILRQYDRKQLFF